MPDIEASRSEPRSVWKYIIPIMDDDVTIEMPHFSRVVYVGNPYYGHTDSVTIWVEVSAHPARKAPWLRKFRIFGTGHIVPERYRYVGTAFAGAGLIWHLYENEG